MSFHSGQRYSYIIPFSVHGVSHRGSELGRFTKDFSDAPLGGDLLEHSFRDGLFTAATDDVKWQAGSVTITSRSGKGVWCMVEQAMLRNK